MKRLISIIMLLLFLLPAIVFGADSFETIPQTNVPVGTRGAGLFMWTITMTASSTTGGYSPFESDWDLDGLFLMAVTNPGAVSPTANTDINIVDAEGSYVFGDTGIFISNSDYTPTYDGSLANRDSITSKRAMPLQNGNYTAVPVNGKVTVLIKNNSVNSAVIKLDIFYIKTEQ